MKGWVVDPSQVHMKILVVNLRRKKYRGEDEEIIEPFNISPSRLRHRHNH